MIRKRMYFLLITLCLSSGFLYGQAGQRGGRNMPQGTITGTIVEAKKQTPMQYTNVVLYSQRDSAQIDGTITDKDGKFRLTNVRPGNYFAEVTFIGFKQKTLDNIAVRPPNLSINLGTIVMSSKALTSQDVVVEAERPAISYQIDRKVIDASRFDAAASGNAVDILENVPSVNVDIEGNVELRGSSNFRVLIDGKPTVLDGNDALQQIPASTIDDIEIITNPSVKYDPEGTTGIINIVLKKNRLEGMSGLVNTNAGMNNKYGVEGLLSLKNDTYTATLG
ncbi:MAG: carboxypeptidase regulatory-like domain-containing protein, partial [Calditrichota bacterium]